MHPVEYMNSLSELKHQFELKQLPILGFMGWWLDTSIGRFTLAEGQLYCDGEPMTRKVIETITFLITGRILTSSELREKYNYGKPQAWEVEEPTSRLSDVQAAQGKRSKAGTTRKGRSGKSK